MSAWTMATACGRRSLASGTVNRSMLGEVSVAGLQLMAAADAAKVPLSAALMHAAMALACKCVCGDAGAGVAERSSLVHFAMPTGAMAMGVVAAVALVAAVEAVAVTEFVVAAMAIAAMATAAMEIAALLDVMGVTKAVAVAGPIFAGSQARMLRKWLSPCDG